MNLLLSMEGSGLEPASAEPEMTRAARLYDFASTRYPPPLLQRRSCDLGTLPGFDN
jgi:hypothetical protein